MDMYRRGTSAGKSRYCENHGRKEESLLTYFLISIFTALKQFYTHNNSVQFDALGCMQHAHP
jgi:hypothetical protein